jgi:hypothetical protein
MKNATLLVGCHFLQSVGTDIPADFILGGELSVASGAVAFLDFAEGLRRHAVQCSQPRLEAEGHRFQRGLGRRRWDALREHTSAQTSARAFKDVIDRIVVKGTFNTRSARAWPQSTAMAGQSNPWDFSWDFWCSSWDFSGLICPFSPICCAWYKALRSLFSVV